MSLGISPAAQEDVARAIRNYNTKPDRYGEAFRAEFDHALVAITESPGLYALAEDGVEGREIREYYIPRFQQRVIYEVRGEDVLVLAVVHASRRPGAWHRNM
jgi:plasmid stabilization system protein ParE